MNYLYHNQFFTANNNNEDPLMANYYYYDNSISPHQQTNAVIKQQNVIPVYPYSNDYADVLQDDTFSIASYPIVPDLHAALPLSIASAATYLHVDQTQPFYYQSDLSPQLSECFSTSSTSTSSFNMYYYPHDPAFMDSLFPPVMDSNSNNDSSSSSSSSKKKRKTTSLTDKRHICPVCSHRSKRKHNLVEHMLTHNPHRPKSFLCSHCARPFARKYDMKRHEKIHTRSI
ncbi:uncharacterized protein ATC70_006757 [Mucor velutinosus]|uniref:C2H2-type domain-containing protein n=1 Tax=Mucor velutinosus TaxID=708070 RepID=A0AAN7DP27_9FUNG|nr:hypothetical protein ATC70_006757 [Mucor velutinosus]